MLGSIGSRESMSVVGVCIYSIASICVCVYKVGAPKSQVTALSHKLPWNYASA